MTSVVLENIYNHIFTDFTSINTVFTQTWKHFIFNGQILQKCPPPKIECEIINNIEICRTLKPINYDGFFCDGICNTGCGKGQKTNLSPPPPPPLPTYNMIAIKGINTIINTEFSISLHIPVFFINLTGFTITGTNGYLSIHTSPGELQKIYRPVYESNQNYINSSYVPNKIIINKDNYLSYMNADPINITDTSGTLLFINEALVVNIEIYTNGNPLLIIIFSTLVDIKCYQKMPIYPKSVFTAKAELEKPTPFKFDINLIRIIVIDIFIFLVYITLE